jgi:hypothetical protein
MNNSLEEIMVDVIRKMDWKPGLTDLEKELLILNLVSMAKVKGYALFIDELLSDTEEPDNPNGDEYEEVTSLELRKFYEERIFELSRKELVEQLSAFLHKYAVVE